MCLLCFNFIYAKVYFVCHTMSVNICVCCVSILKYIWCVIQCLYIYIYIYICVCCASVFIVLIVRVYAYILKHYEKVLYIICHACVCLYIYICVCIYICRLIAKGTELALTLGLVGGTSRR